MLIKIVRKIMGRYVAGSVESELKMIRENYGWGPFSCHFSPIVIFRLDGRYNTYGFADRLRGMISAYAYAKAIGSTFRIDHVDPFELSAFFAPNEVDWRMREDEVSYNLWQAQPLMVIDYDDGSRVPYMPKHRQYHVYANAGFVDVINKYYHKQYTYHGLFHELFKPSQRLLDAIAPYHKYIEEGFISVSFRFVQLMGDFQDCYGDVLEEQERDALIEKCIDFLRQIRAKHAEVKHVLVTSDSATFMSRVSMQDSVFVLPGEIGHIGFMKSDAIFLKTFMDFYMISQARKAYMGYTGKMYKSNFARSAAQTTGIPYEGIQF